MAIGFTDLTSTVRRPDKLMQASSTPNILSANFGDGYQQRIAKGINNLQQQYVVSFANRTKEEIKVELQNLILPYQIQIIVEKLQLK